MTTDTTDRIDRIARIAGDGNRIKWMRAPERAARASELRETFTREELASWVHEAVARRNERVTRATAHNAGSDMIDALRGPHDFGCQIRLVRWAAGLTADYYGSAAEMRRHPTT